MICLLVYVVCLGGVSAVHDELRHSAFLHDLEVVHEEALPPEAEDEGETLFAISDLDNGRGALVSNLEVSSSESGVRSRNKNGSFAYHTDNALTDILSGLWDTDYFPTLASGFSKASTKVYIERMSDTDEESFLHGQMGKWQRESAFTATSKKFEGKQGNGQRLLVVKQIHHLHMDNVLIKLEQRLDSMSPVRHHGWLTKYDNGWVISWDNGRAWAREHAKTGSGEAESDDNAAHAKTLSLSLINEWDSACAAKPGLFGTNAVNFDVQAQFTLSSGFLLKAPGITADIVFSAAPGTAASDQTRLTCILEEMKDFTVANSNSSEAAAATAGASDAIIHRFTKWAGLSKMAECWATFEITLSFTLLPFPPFVWPLPEIGADFDWPLTFKEIMACSVHANATSYISDAFEAKPKQSDAQLEKMSEELQAAAMSAPASKLNFKFSQGPNFNLFPFASGVGWNWNVDVSLTVSLRKMMMSWRRGERALLKEPVSSCEADREEYFLALRAWARSAHDLARSSCTLVHRTLAAITRNHPEVDLQRDPLSLMPFLEHLGSEQYKQEDSTKFSFGTGTIYVGTDGLGLSYAHSLIHEDRGYHNSACKPFQEFVNIYQSRVVPARTDLLSVAREETCELGSIPPLQYTSCRAVDKIFPRDLPAFPKIMLQRGVDGAAPTSLHLTDSQCTRCLRTTSFGSPCDFCPDELWHSGPGGSATCRAHLSYLAHRPCMRAKTEVDLDYFDQHGVRDFAGLCVQEENIVWADTKERAHYDLPFVEALMARGAPTEFGKANFTKILENIVEPRAPH